MSVEGRATFPVTGAVHVNVPDAPLAIDAIEAGLGPVNAPIAAVPVVNFVRADGTTLFTAPPVLFVTVITKVAVSPEKRQVGVTAIAAVRLQLEPEVMVIAGVVTVLEVLDVPETVVQLAPVLAQAVKVTVPGVPPAVYVQTILPVSLPDPKAPRLRLAGFEVVLTLTPVGVGGFVTEVTVTAAVDLFVTVMVSVNWQPVPTLYVDGTRVMDSNFHVHEEVVELGLRHILEPENLADALASWSVRSVVEAILSMLKVKSLLVPGVI